MLLYPPYLLAIAALYLAHVLVEAAETAPLINDVPAAQSIPTASVNDQRGSFATSLQQLALPPRSFSASAATVADQQLLSGLSSASSPSLGKSQLEKLVPVQWFANLQVRQDCVFEIIQEIIATYKHWALLDDAEVVKVLKRVKELPELPRES